MKSKQLLSIVVILAVEGGFKSVAQRPEVIIVFLGDEA